MTEQTNISLVALGVPNEQVVAQIRSFTEYEDFVSAAMVVRQYRDKSQWVLGMLARGVSTKYGEQTITKFAKEIGIRVATLMGYRWVVDQYLSVNENFNPSERIPFSTLKAAAALPPEAREQLLEQAEADGMSVERARVEVHKQQGKQIKPKFRVEFCDAHNLWYFIPEDLSQWEAYHD